MTCLYLSVVWGSIAVTCAIDPKIAHADVTFSEVAAEAGLTYVQREVNKSMAITGGAAAGDYDGDGWDDLYVTRHGGSDILYRNRGDGTFEDVTVAAGLVLDESTSGAGWADIDGDGDLDLYVTGFGTLRNYLFINGGDGTFTEEAESRGAAVVTDRKHNGFSVNFGDYNLDGFVDVHTAEWSTVIHAEDSHSRLLRNSGAALPGTFDDVTDAAGVRPGENFHFASTFADMDMDGWPDLIIASDLSSSELWWNNQDGTFVSGFNEANGFIHSGSDMGSTLGDYDNDGDLDWFMSTINDNSLFRNDGGRRVVEVAEPMGIKVGGWGWGTAFFDYDNDGDLDIIMTNGNSVNAWTLTEPNYLWRNEGPDQPMTDVSAETGINDESFGRGLLVFDYDRDGDLDFFIANHADTPRLYRNDGGNANHWLRVAFQNKQENTEGLGVKIWVRSFPSGLTQYREMGVSTHFVGQSERVAHFGLGATLPDRIAVTMEAPGGYRYTIDDASPDTTIILDASDFDGDQLKNQDEGLPDLDGDGLPNYLDLDSDGDGFCDNIEFTLNGDFRDGDVLPPSPEVGGDVNYDSVANALDVQLTINRILGLETCYGADIDRDGAENAVDVQLAISAVLE
jgi:hypothetical protein